MNLQRHIKKCGDKKEVEDLKCNVWGKSYSSKSVLTRHLKDSPKIKKTSKRIKTEVGFVKFDEVTVLGKETIEKNNDSLMCEECGYEAVRKGHLEQQIERNHRNTPKMGRKRKSDSNENLSRATKYRRLKEEVEEVKSSDIKTEYFKNKLKVDDLKSVNTNC